jgi:hypothetical protein
MREHHNQHGTDTPPFQWRQASIKESTKENLGIRARDGLGCYRLLAEIFEIPAALDNLLGRHPAMSRDLCLAWMIAASDRLLRIEEASR